MKDITHIQMLVEDILIEHGIKGTITGSCFEIDDSFDPCINYIFYVILKEHYSDECLSYIQEEALAVAETQGLLDSDSVPENVIIEWD